MSLPRTVAEIREAYLSFFEERGHTRLASDSLIPSNDPTLLFTGAGMNQFKNEFLGQGRTDITRATTAQKCLRVPDLDNVGVTPRHHTFFEMLGNFSFGDYFKDETIPWEWEFFTSVLGFDAERMVVTVFNDDDQAWKIWHDVVGLPSARIYRLDEAENFWPSSAPSQGPNGPCGPCSEIYFDQNPGEKMPANAGLSELPGRFLEVGNFVFTQFDRQSDGSLPALPQKNIDVGLGLERIAAVLQNAPNNFETDLFAPTLDALQSLSGKSYGQNNEADIQMRRIADHCRAVYFCISDGAAPAREGRGYVVRKILRRAVRDGIALGLNNTFLADLLPAVQATMGQAYPQLHEHQNTIESMCQAEEERFRDVYKRGITRLDEAVGNCQKAGETTFPASVAFELHDTWGFPVDITEVVVKDHKLQFDQAGFNQAMEEQRDRARSGSEMKGDVFAESLPGKLSTAGISQSEFKGYANSESPAQLLAILRDKNLVDQAVCGEQLEVVLDTTCFYATGGGQIGDSGEFFNADGNSIFSVKETHKEGDFIFHCGVANIDFKVNELISAKVNFTQRLATERHHTGTHLLHAALKKILGEHVTQAGSSVDATRLRFDYTNPNAPNGEQLAEIEKLVNAQVIAANLVSTKNCALDEAKAEGVTALFGEKYGDTVRVVSVADFSAELCGGTHVKNTGQIGLFRIISDRALSAGVRRLEAVAGEAAMKLASKDRSLISELAAQLKTPAAGLTDKIDNLRQQLKEAKQASRSDAPDIKELVESLNVLPGSDLAWSYLPGVDARTLAMLTDKLKQQPEVPKVCLLIGGDAKSVPYVILCADNSGLKAGDLAKLFGRQVGGGGGGRADFAQGKGKKGSDLESAVANFHQELSSNT